jgi:hypothetical protein
VAGFGLSIVLLEHERGERLIWLPRDVVDRLRHLRGPGESFSDAIIRLAEDVGAA